MFVLRNAGRAVARRPWRTGLTAAAALIVSFGAMVSTAVIGEDAHARGPAYDERQTSAQIRPTARTAASFDGADSSSVSQYLTWDDYTKVATAAQEAGITFTYALTEDVPVRQTSSLKAIPGTDDASDDATGGKLQLRAFSSVDAARKNDWGRYRVVEGKHLSYGRGVKGALLSRQLAERNHLKVGDSFTVARPDDASKTIKLTVRGLYDYDAPAQGQKAKLAKDNRLNAIYVAYYAFGMAGLDSQTADDGDGWAKPDLDITFGLSSPADYRKFVKAAAKAKLGDTHEVVSPSLEEYRRSIEPLGRAAGTMRTVLWSLVGVGGVLLLALTVSGAWVRRDGEIGAGLVVGATRARLGWQFMLESFMVTLPALAVGALAGGLSARPIGAALAGGHATPPTSGGVWQVVGWGLGAVLVLGIVAMLRVVTWNTAKLFPGEGGATTAPAQADTDHGTDDATDAASTVDTTKTEATA